MSVSSSTSSVSYVGNASTTTAYVVPFVFFDATDLKVYSIDAAGVSTLLALSTNYTVTGGSGASGSIVTTAAIPATSTVIITRSVPYTQLTSFTTGDRLPAASIEKSLDKLTMQAQQLSRNSLPDTANTQGSAPFALQLDAAGGAPVWKEKIPNGVVTTPKIADGNVTTAKIADGSITTEKIADGSVQTVDLANSSVTTAKVADGAITTAKIVDGNVTNSKIQDYCITSTKMDVGSVGTPAIANGSIIPSKLSFGGPSWDITGAFSASSFVGPLTGNVTGNLTGTASAVADGAVTTSKIADGAITTSKIANGAVVTSDLADAAVSAAKLATDVTNRISKAWARYNASSNTIPASYNIPSVSVLGVGDYRFNFALSLPVNSASVVAICSTQNGSGVGTPIMACVHSQATGSVRIQTGVLDPVDGSFLLIDPAVVFVSIFGN